MMTLKINRIKQNSKFTSGKFELLDNDQVLQKGATLELGIGECIDMGSYLI